MNVLFDLDGTLTDPGEGFVACISYALSKLDCRTYTDDEIRKYVGPPLEETLARLLEGEGAKIPAAVALYRERYGREGLFQNAIYPGIEAALGELRARGMRLFVATSKLTVFATRILEHFGLGHYFSAIYGSEPDGTHSNKVQLLSHILARESLTAAESIMVGDRAQDIAAALAHGLRPIGALWGYGSEAELVAAGARTLCGQPSELPPLIARIHG